MDYIFTVNNSDTLFNLPNMPRSANVCFRFEILVTALFTAACVLSCIMGIHVNIASILPEDDGRLFSKRHAAPAIEYAIEYLHNETDYLNGHTFSVSFKDSKCSSANGMNEAINVYMENKVDVFLGPVCDFAAAPVARQTLFWNIPMVSVGAFARDFNTYRHTEYGLLTRVAPFNFVSMSSAYLNIVKFHAWNRFKIIYEKDGQGEFMEAFCQLASSSIHYEATAREPNIIQDYFKLLGDNEEILKTEVGITYAGESLLLLT